MTIRAALIAVAAFGTAGLPQLLWQTAFAESDGRERVAQYKSDKSVPGALPGRSESSEEADPSTRAVRKKAKKPASKEKEGKKDVPATGTKKDRQ